MAPLSLIGRSRGRCDAAVIISQRRLVALAPQIAGSATRPGGAYHSVLPSPTSPPERRTLPGCAHSSEPRAFGMYHPHVGAGLVSVTAVRVRPLDWAESAQMTRQSCRRARWVGAHGRCLAGDQRLGCSQVSLTPGRGSLSRRRGGSSGNPGAPNARASTP
jgi:hypothetical protein